jgi:hypothetical protein
MAIGIRYFGSTKPGPGVTPIKVVDKVKNPFGKKNYPINWMTGKHLALGEEASSGAGSTGSTGGGGGGGAVTIEYSTTTHVLRYRNFGGEWITIDTAVPET